MMNKLNYYLKEIKKTDDHRESLDACLSKHMTGKRFQITNKRFNGQPFGDSKPSLYGRIFTIEPRKVFVDNGKLYLNLGYRQYARLGDGIFLDEV